MKRALDNPEFEPAERDPKAIRRTVITLVAIMLVGGFLIVWKYKQKMADEAEEIRKGRSAMSLGNVKKNFQTKGIDGKIYDFTILEGKLTLMAAISTKLPETSTLIIEEMKKAEAHFKEQEDLQFVCISADSESQVPLAELKAFADSQGINRDGWYVLTADSEHFTGYLKDGLKLGLVTKKNKETGERELPDLLRIVDPSLRIRGEISDFKFNYYHEVEQRTAEELKADPSLAENPKVQERLHRNQNAVSLNREKMYKNIAYIFEHETTDVEALKKANRSNRYNIPLMIFGGFILFILIMGYRVKKSRA